MAGQQPPSPRCQAPPLPWPLKPLTARGLSGGRADKRVAPARWTAGGISEVTRLRGTTSCCGRDLGGSRCSVRGPGRRLPGRTSSGGTGARVTGKAREAASPSRRGFRGGPESNPRHPGGEGGPRGGGAARQTPGEPRRGAAWGCPSRPLFGGRSTWPWAARVRSPGAWGAERWARGGRAASRAGCAGGCGEPPPGRVKKKEKSKQREAAADALSPSSERALRGVLRAPSDVASGFARPRPRAAVRARPRAGPP